MEESHVDNMFKAYLETYRRRNIETKGFNQSSCDSGILWLWMTFGDCLLTPAREVGYFAGALSLLFWTVGHLMICTQTMPVSFMWKLLILTFIVNLVSFAGAVMSLQIMFVISYDVLTTITLLVIMLAFGALILIRRSSRKYREHDRITPAPTQQHQIPPAVHKVLTICLGLTSVLALVIVSVTSIYAFEETSPRTSKKLPGLLHQVPLSIVGYVFGCVACLGRWWIDIVIASRFVNELRAVTVYKGGGVMLLISEILYILGVLLLPGSFRVTIVTLPWLIGRFVQCCLQILKLTTPELLFSCASKQCDNGDNANAEDEKIEDFEVVSLLGSSESEERDVHVLFDRSWNVQDKSGLHPIPEESMTSALTRSRALTSTYDVTTTTDSDLSSTSQEQELLWEDDVATLRIPSSFNTTTPSRLRHQRLSLASQIETQSQTSRQTNDQRVCSWISQSTPEEKVPPCLTLTLNWDSTLVSVNNITDEMFGNKKFNFYGALSLSSRKKSF